MRWNEMPPMSGSLCEVVALKCLIHVIQITHSILMPASFTTLPHLSSSDTINWDIASGVDRLT